MAIAGLALCAMSACVLLGRDEADAELHAFLVGDEDGSTDTERSAHLERAIAIAPDRARYYEVRAGFRAEHGDLVRAENDLDRAITLEDRPYLRFRRGLVRHARGAHVDALDDLDRAITAQPDNTQFYRPRVLTLLALGRPADALVDADVMIRDAPQWAESHYARGAALEALGRTSDAIASYDAAIVRRPELVYAWEARADARASIGEAAGAASDRAEAARLRPSAMPSTLDPASL